MTLFVFKDKRTECFQTWKRGAPPQTFQGERGQDLHRVCPGVPRQRRISCTRGESKEILFLYRVGLSIAKSSFCVLSPEGPATPSPMSQEVEKNGDHRIGGGSKARVTLRRVQLQGRLTSSTAKVAKIHTASTSFQRNDSPSWSADTHKDLPGYPARSSMADQWSRFHKAMLSCLDRGFVQNWPYP